jgi:luciferase family oxidoreductase group 1
LRLSVLDQSPAMTGVAEDVAIRQTIEMAELCDRLGYHRFWVSEHHGSSSIVGSAPEILVAAIAARTQRIRVGTAGVLLPHYAPIKVAEQFLVLESIAPGRIDLGLGRAPGGDGRWSYALNPTGDQAVERFPAHVRDIVAWTSGKPLPEGHPSVTLRLTPRPASAPEVWVLGSSDYGAQVAAYLGLPYCFAAFIADRGAEQALEIYRRYYQPSERHPEPYATACVFALAADTNEQARNVFATRARQRLNRDRGIRLPLVPWQEALADPRSPAEEMRFQQLTETALIGDGATCAAKLRSYAQSLELDELTILTHTYDIADRRRSFELLAKEFAL